MKFRVSTWGEEVELKYGKAIRGYDTDSGPYRVFGTNGPVGWTGDSLTEGPGVILGRKGAYRGVHFSKEPFWVIDTAYYLEPKSSLNFRWLYYAAIASKLGEIDDGSPIPSTTRAAVRDVPLLVPSADVQDSIANVLGSLDDKIELNRRMNETLEAMARAIFRSWFVDFDPVRIKARGGDPTAELGLSPEIAALFPDSFQDSELGQIPQGWKASTVGKEFRLTMGQSPPGESYNSSGEGIPFYQGKTDYGWRFPERRLSCTAPTRFAEEGDTLVSVRAPVGALNVANERCCIGRGLAAIRHLSGSMSLTYYAMGELSDQFKVFEESGTVFGSITKQGFVGLPFVTPSLEVALAFNHLVGAIDLQIAANERESSTLAETRDYLLPRLLSGSLCAGAENA